MSITPSFGVGQSDLRIAPPMAHICAESVMATSWCFFSLIGETLAGVQWRTYQWEHLENEIFMLNSKLGFNKCTFRNCCECVFNKLILHYLAKNLYPVSMEVCGLFLKFTDPQKSSSKVQSQIALKVPTELRDTVGVRANHARNCILCQLALPYLRSMCASNFVGRTRCHAVE